MFFQCNGMKSCFCRGHAQCNWVKMFLVAYFFFTIVSFICISSDEFLPKSKYLNKYEIRVIRLKYINIKCNFKEFIYCVRQQKWKGGKDLGNLSGWCGGKVSIQGVVALWEDCMNIPTDVPIMLFNLIWRHFALKIIKSV